jgi:hypothetical protein
MDGSSFFLYYTKREENMCYFNSPGGELIYIQLRLLCRLTSVRRMTKGPGTSFSLAWIPPVNKLIFHTTLRCYVWLYTVHIKKGNNREKRRKTQQCILSLSLSIRCVAKFQILSIKVNCTAFLFYNPKVNKKTEENSLFQTSLPLR